jgi:transposase InsO family protein
MNDNKLKTRFTIERIQEGTLNQQDVEEVNINVYNAYDLFKEFQNGKTITISEELMLKEQKSDKILSKVRYWLENGTLPPNVTLMPNTVLKGFANRYQELAIHPDSGLLCKIEYDENGFGHEKGKFKVCVPLSLIIAIFYQSHAGHLQGHHGIQKTIQMIQQYFYFPGLIKWIHALVQDCIPCNESKNIRKDLQNPRLLSPIRQVTETGQTIHIDYKGAISPNSKGYNYILMIIDAYSRLVYPKATRYADAKTTIQVMENYICTFGIPQIIVFDRGTHFINKEFMHWTTNLGIECRPLSGYNPWSNGIVEVQNRLMGTYFRLFVEQNPNNWADLVPQWAFSQNTSMISNFGMTPHEIHFGIKPNVPLTLKLGIFRDKNKLCVREINGCCEGLGNHSHDPTETCNAFTKKFLKGEVPSNILQKERNLGRIYQTVETQSKMNDPEQVYRQRNLTRLAKQLPEGQEVLVENKQIVKGISTKLLPLRKGIFEVYKRVSPVTYHVKMTKEPFSETKRHRGMLLPYYAKEKEIPRLVQKYLVDQENDDYYYYDDNELEGLVRGENVQPQIRQNQPPPGPPGPGDGNDNDIDDDDDDNDNTGNRTPTGVEIRTRLQQRLFNQMADKTTQPQTGDTNVETEQINPQMRKRVNFALPNVPVTPPQAQRQNERQDTPRPQTSNQQRILTTPQTFTHILSPQPNVTPRRIVQQCTTPLQTLTPFTPQMNTSLQTPATNREEFQRKMPRGKNRTSTPIREELTPPTNADNALRYRISPTGYNYDFHEKSSSNYPTRTNQNITGISGFHSSNQTENTNRPTTSRHLTDTFTQNYPQQLTNPNTTGNITRNMSTRSKTYSQTASQNLTGNTTQNVSQQQQLFQNQPLVEQNQQSTNQQRRQSQRLVMQDQPIFQNQPLVVQNQPQPQIQQGMQNQSTAQNQPQQRRKSTRTVLPPEYYGYDKEGFY